MKSNLICLRRLKSLMGHIIQCRNPRKTLKIVSRRTLFSPYQYRHFVIFRVFPWILMIRLQEKENTCQSMISIKLLYTLIEITLLHGCSPINLLHICRAAFLKNTLCGNALMLVTSFGSVIHYMYLVTILEINVNSLRKNLTLSFLC